MTTTRNRNRQVSLLDYARCVAAQMAFLLEQDELPTLADHQVADYYVHGVSVDAAAADLVARGV